MTATIIILICAAALVVYAVIGTVRKARGQSKSSCCGSPEIKTLKKVEDTDESHYPYRYDVSINGMHCANCARTVQNHLNMGEGIWATVDLGKKRAKILAKQEMSEEDFQRLLWDTQYKLTVRE